MPLVWRDNDSCVRARQWLMRVVINCVIPDTLYIFQAESSRDINPFFIYQLTLSRHNITKLFFMFEDEIGECTSGRI